MQILTLWTMELQGADRGTQTQTKGTNPTKMRVRCAPLRTCRLVLKTALARLLANIVASQNLGKRKVQTKAPT
jgi:hypothetical protein